MSVSHFEFPDREVNHIFKLDTPATSYCIGIVDEECFVGHLYFGERLSDNHLESLPLVKEHPAVPSINNRDRGSFLDALLMEYPTHGLGDYRESCLEIETEDGFNAVGLRYLDFEVLSGKDILPGLPSSFGASEDVDTLVLHCIDEPTGLRIDLRYSAFRDVDVITRSVTITNGSEKNIYLSKVYSACLDIEGRDLEAISLHGSWARERIIERHPVGHQKVSVESMRGESSHQDHPFMALCTPNTTDETGEVYAMSFVYSGNFRISAANNQFDVMRFCMGINPVNFKWKLEPGDTFNAPEAVITYSCEGIGKMTRTFHDFFRSHLIRSPYLHKKRPILINNWEATYFDFDTEKLIAIAKDASELGIEMLVMDDGWFGNRYDDNRSLGDWVVNEDKISGGLKHLVDEVNKLGMKFGIWFEPEMVSPDSNLYREHPDWAIAIPGRTPTRMRNQYVLDLSRKEVRDYTYEQVAKILRSANIEYVKWDMNRQLSDLGSATLKSDRMGELSHRYVLGVYELQERLLAEFPKLLLENCSGGGARFDPGMLYFSPQIWCSDDTDAIMRLMIQEGTSLVYPLSAMGAHVSDCPNHTVGRVTPFETRGHVALAGTFGYELDVTKIPEEDRRMIPEQVAMYHKYNDLVREGDYYRVASYSENGSYDCYGVVSKDKSEALYTFVQVLGRANAHNRIIRFKGLDPEREYRIDGEEEVYSGDALMKAGFPVASMWGDFKSRLIYLRES